MLNIFVAIHDQLLVFYINNIKKSKGISSSILFKVGSTFHCPFCSSSSTVDARVGAAKLGTTSKACREWSRPTRRSGTRISTRSSAPRTPMAPSSSRAGRIRARRSTSASAASTRARRTSSRCSSR